MPLTQIPATYLLNNLMWDCAASAWPARELIIGMQRGIGAQ